MMILTVEVAVDDVLSKIACLIFVVAVEFSRNIADLSTVCTDFVVFVVFAVESVTEVKVSSVNLWSEVKKNLKR